MDHGPLWPRAADGQSARQPGVPVVKGGSCHDGVSFAAGISTLTVLALLVGLPAPIAGETVVVNGPKVVVKREGSPGAKCPDGFTNTKGGYSLDSSAQIPIMADGGKDNGH